MVTVEEWMKDRAAYLDFIRNKMTPVMTREELVVHMLDDVLDIYIENAQKNNL